MKKFYVTKKQVDAFIKDKLPKLDYSYDRLIGAVDSTLTYLKSDDGDELKKCHRFYTRVKDRLVILANMIPKHFIVGVVYLETIKKPNGFGYMEVETDCKDKKVISTFINQNRDYDYYDKYGNKYAINEIIK